MTYTIAGYDTWKLASPDYHEAEKEYCCVCDTYIDDGEFCECHCSDCGEELPEADDAHCTNCCECDACMEAYDEIEKHHEATGEWKDMPIITGEKVFTRYPR